MSLLALGHKCHKTDLKTGINPTWRLTIGEYKGIENRAVKSLYNISKTIKKIWKSIKMAGLFVVSAQKKKLSFISKYFP